MCVRWHIRIHKVYLMSSQPIVQDDMFNEEALYNLIRQDPDRVFRELYKRYSAAIFGHLIQLLKVQEDAEEVLQESFVKIWKNLKGYDPQKGRVFTWMLRIARNTGIDQLRKNQNRNAKTSNTPIESVSIASEDLQITDSGLMKVIDTLDDNQKFLVYTLIFKGYTQQEVADEFDIPLGTVKSRFRAAMKKLRENLSGEQLVSILILLNYIMKP
jgi:RNA polymerase sigma factor (sigma-70 family)